MMRRLQWAALAVATVAGGLVACGPNHINAYTPKQRPYTFLEEPERGNNSAGSLWSPNSGVNDAVADNRAQRVGDVVIVTIEESASATQDTALSTSKATERTANVRAFLGLMQQLRTNNGFIEQIGDEGQLINLASDSSFEGSGSGSRNQQMSATVPAIVKKVNARGNLLFVEGHRTLLVNNEEHHFYISGVVRKNDINNLNQISSTEMADAQIEFTGRGAMSDGVDKGWFTRTMDYIWPF
ncbi:MAG: flagellar basal body L-ring protein FlgH [Bradymonadia bacterium]